MLEVVYYVGASFDGFIADPDGGTEWMQPFSKGAPDEGFAARFAGFDCLLLGSGTYEVAIRHGGWSRTYAKKRSWVFTRRDLPVVDPSLELTRDEPSRVVAALAEQGYRRAWLMGGGKLARSFLDQGLLSEVIVGLLPVILGQGIPLFAPSPRSAPLELREARSAGGIVFLTYDVRR